ncbi:MAG: hypothetical protein KAR12_00180 [Methylococcales bacterium]|nr:hypothetical protein [Methylococcales bacterium]
MADGRGSGSAPLVMTQLLSAPSRAANEKKGNQGYKKPGCALPPIGERTLFFHDFSSCLYL